MKDSKEDMRSNTQIAVKEPEKPTASQRFMNMVIKEFSGGVGEVALTDFQKRLAQNYFIVADSVLKAAEERRLKKSEKYRDSLSYIWDNIDLLALSQDVVSAARIGWDPVQDNHVSLVPFKKNAINKYGLTFIPGYRGIELKAKKYGQDVPSAVVVEIVYKNDVFKPIKKSLKNPIETYEFEIVNPFDRGDIIGGFYYHIYSNAPEKNKLVIFSLKDILKRKPEKAAVEFWGGDKDVWENGQKVGTEHVDGWYEKMCYKTVYRAAYRDITIDSQKIDDDYLRLKQQENEFNEAIVEEEIQNNANKNIIDISGAEEVPYSDTQPESPAEPVKETTDDKTEGPGY